MKLYLKIFFFILIYSTKAYSFNWFPEFRLNIKLYLIEERYEIILFLVWDLNSFNKSNYGIFEKANRILSLSYKRIDELNKKLSIYKLKKEINLKERLDYYKFKTLLSIEENCTEKLEKLMEELR